MRILFALLWLLALPACNGITEEMKAAGEAAKRSQHETRETWKRLLTYEPSPQAQIAQRRYCYKRLSDIVCYDSEQHDGSPLVAIQEGMSGRIVAGKQAYEKAQFSNSSVVFAEGSAVSEHVISAPLPPASSPRQGEVVTFGAPSTPVNRQSNPPRPVGENGKCTGNSPFPCKESDYVPNADVGK